MPHFLPGKIWVSELYMPSGASVVIPVMHDDVVWLNRPGYELAHLISDHLHRAYSETGKYLDLLYKFADLEFHEKEIEVRFEKSTKKLFPGIHLSFMMYYAELPSGSFSGYVPLLQIPSSGSTIEELESNMQDNVRLYFARTKKINNIDEIIATQWYSGYFFEAIPVKIKHYTLNELKEIEKLKQKKVLPLVAKKISEFPKSAYFLEREVKNIENSLFGRFRRSVLVAGRSGVGKTALIKEFLHQVFTGKGIKPGVDFWAANATGMISKLTTGSGWQDNMGKVCKELREDQGILYIENFSGLFEVGQYKGSDTSVADYMQEYIKRGDITVISECTDEELAAMDLRSPGYSSLFHIIRLEEPPENTLLDIIRQKVNDLAGEIGIKVDAGALSEALLLQKRFAPYSGFPGKTIRFFEALLIEKSGSGTPLSRNDVFKVFCEESGMPRFLIDPDVELSLEAMEAHFRKNIYGQDEALEVVTDMLAAVKASLVREGKPIASLFFTGPTGVGKTELAKVLADYVFGNRKKVIRFDMSEYSDLISVLRLTGDDNSGQGLLVDAIRKEPFSVVLFDELEKAHMSFYDLLLQVLGEGRLTDAKGNVADFCSTIIIMTSNIGVRSFKWSATGFRRENDDTANIAGHFINEVQKYFRPELFNRLDRIVSFLPLSKGTIRDIVDREISFFKRREGIYYRDVKIEIGKEVLDKLGAEGYDSWYGARQLQRTLRKSLIIPLSRKLNAYDRKKPLEIEVFVSEGEISIEISVRSISKADKRSKAGEYTITELAGQVTDSRRQMQKVENGKCFVGMLSEFDILLMYRKKKKEKFFQDNIRLVRFHKIEALRGKMDSISGNIRMMERESMKIYFDFISMEKTLITRYEQWQKDFEKSKLELYEHAHPQDSNMVLAIYGNASYIEDIYYFYDYLIKRRQYKAKIRSLFFDSSMNSFSYIKMDDDKMKPLFNTGDKRSFVGLEIEVTGNAAFLYLQSERGMIEFDDDDSPRYVIDVVRKKLGNYSTPVNVHRKSFYGGMNNMSVRRRYKKQYFTDSAYSLEISDKKKVHQKVAEYLDESFEVRLMEKLCK